MKLKFTLQQANALFDLFNDHIIPDLPQALEDKLLHILMIKVYKKLRNKLEGKKGQGYSLTLTDEEAIGFHLYFSLRNFGASYIYEHTLIQKQMNLIDKNYK
jgi:hypothetical protein